MSWWTRIFGGQPAQQSKREPPQLPSLPRDAAAYAGMLDTAFSAATDAAVRKISAACADLPQKATGLDIGVHVDQDGEGYVNVMLHVNGPDPYVLEKAIAPHREIFKSTHQPPHGLPLFDPHDVNIDVYEAIAAGVERWITALWPQISGPAVPVCVFLADDFSDRPPLLVQGGRGT
ncbi:DUF6389 family protein [Sulfitobacter sp. JB4-11]|uniref:DUF6389 family protein n=1 Tax=Sulfitobacter rhodophyticola TaxID=3238304 RepID=UPI0035118D60